MKQLPVRTKHYPGDFIMEITREIPTLSKFSPFTFEELRTGIFVYFTHDIAVILQPRRKRICTTKKLSDINDSINNFGPFKVYLGDGTEKIFPLIKDAVLYGQTTYDGSVANIYTRYDNYIGYVDAT